MSEHEATNAAQRLYLAVQHELEQGHLVPGQRLVEPELAARFDVGRNAVREAIQRLEGRGIVDMSRHRSASIRRLSKGEMFDVLDVAESLIVLLARTAAAKIQDADRPLLTNLLADLSADPAHRDERDFARIRRDFYRLMLQIAGNRELERLLPAVGMPIIYAQCRSARFNEMRLDDYRSLIEAVLAGSVPGAERAARVHVEKVRAVIADLD